MAFKSVAAWTAVLQNIAPLPESTGHRLLGQVLSDFAEMGLPNDTGVALPLLESFRGWVLQHKLKFLHYEIMEAVTCDGDHHQRVGDAAAWLAEKLMLPELHPGRDPLVFFLHENIIAFQLVQRLATWQTPEEHRAFLQGNALGWILHARRYSTTQAWPLFLHFLQWGVVPWVWLFEAHELLAAPAKWQGLAAEPAFVTWCLIQRTIAEPVTPTAWLTWFATLPADHAAHTLDAPRAFQAYELWATLQTPGQPETWLALLQMVEPAPAPTGEGLVADLTL